MTPSARISAAIEVFADIEGRRRPAADALKDWGLAHRFAGSGDRAAIAGLVYDMLRRRYAAAYLLGADTPRAIMIGMLKLARALDPAAIAALFSGARFAPEPLASDEANALDSGSLADAPAHVVGDYPEWLDPYLKRVFGAARAEEGAALSRRAPLDLRVNTLKANRDAVAAELSHLNAAPTRWSRSGLRIVLGADSKSPAIQSEPAFLKGHIEVQDEGSQLVAWLARAQPGERVIDLCAGAGGKTLALAAAMEGRGKIFASDLDKRRLAPIHARLERAGVGNVEVRTPKGDIDVLADLLHSADLVLIDAPCSGTGTWRRNPDSKLRMRPGALEVRVREQIEVLDRASGLVKPGGRVAYITCSVLAEENQEQIRMFAARHPEFAVVPPDAADGVLAAMPAEFADAVYVSSEGILMTPLRTGTDGFFIGVLRRTG